MFNFKVAAKKKNKQTNFRFKKIVKIWKKKKKTLSQRNFSMNLAKDSGYTYTSG